MIDIPFEIMDRSLAVKMELRVNWENNAVMWEIGRRPVKAGVSRLNQDSEALVGIWLFSIKFHRHEAFVQNI